MKSEVKTGQMFWGTLLVTGGLLFLLMKFDIIAADLGEAYEFWPALLIIWGLIVIFKNTIIRPVLSIVSAVLLAVVIMSAILQIDNFDDDEFYYNSDYDYYDDVSQDFSEKYDPAITMAKFELNSGAGKIRFTGGTGKLYSAYATNVHRRYHLNSKFDGNYAEIFMFLDEENLNPFNGEFKNNLKVKLNETPVWFLKLNMGAVKNYLDLKDLKVKRVEMNVGASDTFVKLGDKFEKTEIEVNMGAAAFELKIPETSGCKLKTNIILSSTDVTGFEQLNDDYYVTPGYEDAKNKITVKIDGAVSKIVLSRY